MRFDSGDGNLPPTNLWSRSKSDSIRNNQVIMPKRNIQPNWASGRFGSVRPATATTQFEKQVRKLRLTYEDCARSEKLRRWCQENSHRCYIPESLLKVWGIVVEPDHS
jgi:hypothetical protein